MVMRVSVMKDKNSGKLKADIILIAVLVLIGAVIFLFLMFTSQEGSCAEIRIDGKVTALYPLDHDLTETIHTENGDNIIEIKDGGICMKDADCPDKLCVHMGTISKMGQSVICLPHKLVIEVTDGQAQDVDVIVK